MKVPFNVESYLRRAELVYGDRVGIVDEPDVPGGGLGELTWTDVAAHARGQAARLDELGIGFGDRVAIVSMNAARFMISLFGVSGFGRALVPINFRLNTDEISYIVEHSGARMLLVDPDLEDTVSSIDVEHRVVLGTASDPELYRMGVEPVPWEADEDATCTINYTSGTTARPKGVQLTHRSNWVNAAVFGWHMGVSDRDVYLHTLPQFHVNGWGLPYAMAGMGARNIMLRKVDGAEILRRVEQHGVTMLSGAPAVASMVLDAARSWDGEIPGRGRVRMIVAGAPPPTATIEAIGTDLGWEFNQIYGLTETAPLLTINRAREEWDDLSTSQRAAKLGRAGSPAIGVDIRISEQGEILARSNHVLEGYWDNPEASADALEGGWFHTGDGGFLDDDNYVTISDRKKDVIISGGENVSSIEVEDTLFSHPAVAEVAVIGVPDEKWGETVKALVVLTPGSDAGERELIDYCREKLAHYKCPTSIDFREELARTATGKLQKFKLRAPFWEGRDKLVN